MVALARSIGPDIVHCHDIQRSRPGMAMKSLTGCLVVYDAHEIYEEIADGSRRTADRYRKIHTAGLPTVDGFVTINESIAGWYRDHYPALPPATIVMNATTEPRRSITTVGSMPPPGSPRAVASCSTRVAFPRSVA